MWIVATAVVGGGLGYLGAKASADGSKKAAKTQAAATDRATAMQMEYYNDLLAFQKSTYADSQKAYAEGKPFRDIALQEAQRNNVYAAKYMNQYMPMLEREINKAPGDARKFYGLASERGTSDIMSNMSAFGLEDSSTAGKAVGTFQEGLSAQESRDMINVNQGRVSNLMNLYSHRATGSSANAGAGAAQGLLGTSAGLMGQAGQAMSGIGQNIMAGGAVKAGLIGNTANIWGGMMGNLGNAAMQYGFSQPQGTTPVGTGINLPSGVGLSVSSGGGSSPYSGYSGYSGYNAPTFNKPNQGGYF